METLYFFNSFNRTYSFRLSDLDAETFQKVSKALDAFDITFRTPER